MCARERGTLCTMKGRRKLPKVYMVSRKGIIEVGM